MSVAALFAAYPEIEARIPVLRLGTFPTRVHRLGRLGADTGARELWIKRDDESGETYGGNKVRKLELLLADARAKGATRLELVGGLGSNLMVAAALYGRPLGFEVHASAVTHDMTDHARDNLRAALAAGATVDVLSARAQVPLRYLAGYARHRLSPNGAVPYFLLPGGSSPVGTLGWVGAAFELREQVRRGEIAEPEVIAVPLGSGGTLAGLVLGARLAGLRSRIVGVRVVERTIANATATALIANGALRLLRRAGAPVPKLRLGPRDFEVIHGFFGGAYGRPSPPARDAVVRMRELEGIALETTYTGKALAGLLDLLRRERLHAKPLLFWNTVSSADLTPLLARAPRREDLPADLRRWVD
jgi:D-cysteine desulfhydrase